MGRPRAILLLWASFTQALGLLVRPCLADTPYKEYRYRRSAHKYWNFYFLTYHYVPTCTTRIRYVYLTSKRLSDFKYVFLSHCFGLTAPLQTDQDLDSAWSLNTDPDLAWSLHVYPYPDLGSRGIYFFILHSVNKKFYEGGIYDFAGSACFYCVSGSRNRNEIQCSDLILCPKVRFCRVSYFGNSPKFIGYNY